MSDIDSGAISETPQKQCLQTIAGLVMNAYQALNTDPAGAACYLAQACEAVQNIQTHSQGESISEKGFTSVQMQRIRQYIEVHLDQPMRVEDLVGLCDMSEGHFFRCFRNTFKLSPMCFVMQRRINYAQKLMLTTFQSLAEVAINAGFYDHSHFVRVFRRHEGCAPGEWRRLNGRSVTPQVPQ